MYPRGLYTGSDLCRHCGRDFLYPVYGWRGWCNDCRSESVYARGRDGARSHFCTAWVKHAKVANQCRHVVRLRYSDDADAALCWMHRTHGSAKAPSGNAEGLGRVG